MMTMPYDNSLKGRRDKCYEISSRQNSYVPDNMYVISRNVRDVNRTLTDLSVIGSMNTVKWNVDRLAEHAQNLEQFAEASTQRDDEESTLSYSIAPPSPP